MKPKMKVKRLATAADVDAYSDTCHGLCYKLYIFAILLLLGDFT